MSKVTMCSEVGKLKKSHNIIKLSILSKYWEDTLLLLSPFPPQPISTHSPHKPHHLHPCVTSHPLPVLPFTWFPRNLQVVFFVLKKFIDIFPPCPLSLFLSLLQPFFSALIIKKTEETINCLMFSHCAVWKCSVTHMVKLQQEHLACRSQTASCLCPAPSPPPPQK